MAHQYEIVKEGTYKAKAKDWSCEYVGANNTPAVKVKFQFTEDGFTRVLTWTGWLKTKAGTSNKGTLKTLIKCGFRDLTWENFRKGAEGRALDTDKEMEIVVEHAQGKDGKPFATIKWVNLPGEQHAGGAMKSADDLSGFLDIAGDMIALKDEMKVTDAVEDDLPWN